MSIQESLKAKLPNSRNGIVKFMGETLHVKLLSQKDYREQNYKSAATDAEIVSFVAANFLDPATGKPAFTEDFLRDELPLAKLMELMRVYFRAQGGGGLEEAEKNLGATPKE